jgi:hypothetical protein
VGKILNFLFKFDDFYFLHLNILAQKNVELGSFGVKTRKKEPWATR